MVEIEINPMKLTSVPHINGYIEGYVLDYHTVRSTPTDDPYFRFDTKRTELGELLYKIKYRQDLAIEECIVSIDLIVNTAQNFIKRKGWMEGEMSIDYIVPAPYSNFKRKIQPVALFAQKLAENLGIPYKEALVKNGKFKQQQMKDINCWEERQRVLKATIQVNERNIVKNKTILFLDDLIESGTTVRTSIEVLLKDGGAQAIFVLVLTRTH